MVTGRYVQQGVLPIPAFAPPLSYSLRVSLVRRHAPRLAPNRIEFSGIRFAFSLARFGWVRIKYQHPGERWTA